ncbi:riboflavin biosynthesis protein RibD [Comamonas serinivorans]|uniref:Riboflavin biosynthesis protein RibD n=1 Tax=Comamonas serinivorans TaxID=1082851 RepID=A0A1Y0ELL8_9BURK|nr:bifunctional diaminohydroxyphosphoribosylaminopyrimidine deaminase/5-amino-6-(5-phosphoribosylamino)uracil reductase RibD [Comamonas serinivorans]ARU04298.1 riboflavin biosynthesis protein RibD [Comamonas serinivorans]
MPHLTTPPSPWMQRALDQAGLALGHSDPNPSVGAVIVSPAGAVLGEGHTQAVGGPHAEVMALRDAAARGHDVRGATAYVTLEPCAHHGRTGPCCEALSAAGIGRVVAALRDPNPRVAGGGFAHLVAAGVQVEVGDGAEAARELMRGFLSRMTRGRPWVRLKVAASLDGFTALPNGHSQWITGEAARADGQRWRQRASCILTGSGTLLADDPLLNVRLPGTTRQPALVIVDSQLRTPPTAQALTLGQRPVWIATAEPELHAPGHAAWLARQQALRQVLMPAHGNLSPTASPPALLDLPHRPGPRPQVDLAALLLALAAREVNEVHVEAGAGLNGALLRAGLVDEIVAYVAPTLLGSGLGWASAWGPVTDAQAATSVQSAPGVAGEPTAPPRDAASGVGQPPFFATVSAAPRGRFLDLLPLGDDLRLRLLLGAEAPG